MNNNSNHQGSSIFRRVGLGRLLLKYWYTPSAELRALIADGGPLGRARIRAGRREMELAATQLPPPPPGVGGHSLRPHLLTGNRYWSQTVFCLFSLASVSGRSLEPVIIDDGSLTEEQAAHLQRLFPSARLRRPDSILAILEARLPSSRYPYLRERREAYPHIRKLIDLHLDNPGWKLVMDSDLLFFRRPDALIAWMDAPTRPLHGTDSEESYGYSRGLMESLTGCALASQVNVGLCGLNGTDIDWDRLEKWTATLMQKQGSHYFLEQALSAMLMAGKECVRLPFADYQTPPSKAECQAPRAVMHHYVAASKRWYFTRCWREVYCPASDPRNQAS